MSKPGFVVPAIVETICRDTNNLIFQRAAEIGEAIGLKKEKALIEILTGKPHTHGKR